MIFKKENDEFLLNLALKNNMDMDRVLSAYLVVGDDALLLLHIFEGQEMKIPSKKRLGVANMRQIHYIEDDAQEYADYDKYDCIEKDGKMWSVVAKERKILNHRYIPVIESSEMEKEND